MEQERLAKGRQEDEKAKARKEQLMKVVPYDVSEGKQLEPYLLVFDNGPSPIAA
jgi:hypothetical protein